MTRVFSYEQAQQGHVVVPSRADFEAAIEAFENAATREITAGTLSGAVVFGSVAIGAYSYTSDFDCLVIPPEHSREGTAAANRVIHETDPGGKIEVNAITHPKARLASGRHEIDRFFGTHLVGPSRIVFGEDPATYLTFSNPEAFPLLINYIRHKKRSVANSTLQNKEQNQRLQRIIELPLAVGRKALRALDEIEGTNNATVDSANKLQVVPASLALFDRFGLGETPRAILALSSSYKEALAAVLAEGISKAEYETVLREISYAGLKAGTWLDALDDCLEETFAKH